MGAAVEQLTSRVRAADRFATPHAELRAIQVEAMNERFQERKDRIKLLGHRAEGGGRRPRSGRARTWCRCCSRTPPTRAIRRAS